VALANPGGAEYLFIGYNPNSSNDRSHNEWHEVPDGAEYAKTGLKGVFNDNVQAIWPRAAYEGGCAMNAVYFRPATPRDLPLSKRDAEAFCIPRTQDLIEILRPRNLVLIGLGTADALGFPRGAALVEADPKRGFVAYPREKVQSRITPLKRPRF
jgi:hypothetical protein